MQPTRNVVRTHWLAIGGVVLGAVLGVTGGALGQMADECGAGAGAPLLVVGTPLNGDTSLASPSGALTDSLCGGFTGSGGWADVFARFVPATSGAYKFTTCGAGADTILSVHSGCPVSDANTLECDDDDDDCSPSSTVTVVLSAGVEYHVRVATSLFGEGGPFALNVSSVTAPANDACGAAIAIAPGGSVAGTNVNATGRQVANCILNGNGDGADVWYSLAIASAGVYTIDVTDAAPPQADFVLTLHDACGGAPLACNDNDWSANIPRMRRYLTPGAYLVRVAGNRGFSGRASEGTFTLNASTAQAQLANDECAAATVITPGSSVDATTVGATPAAAGPITTSCSTQDRIDVWYALTPPSTAQYAITLSPSGGWDAVLSVWEGCGGNQISCGNGTQRLILNSGATYLLRVSGTLDATGAFTLDVDGGTPIPPNDLCEHAGVISVGSVTATNAAASGIDETPDCAYNDLGDVWFSFVPAINGFYTFDTSGSTGLTDTSIALYDTCGGPVLVCNDDIAPNAGTPNRLSRVGRTLTAGTPVLVRVAGTNEAAGTFTLNVAGPGTAPTVPANDTCEGAALITGTSVVSVDARAATPDQPTDCIFGGLAQTSYGVWYKFVAPDHGALQLTENGTIATSVVSFTEDCPVAIPVFPLQCGQITFELEPGDSRLFLVGVQGVEYPNAPYLVSATWTPQLGCCQTSSACTLTAHSACTGTWTDGLCGPSVAAVGGTNLPITIMNPTTNGQPIYKDSTVTVTDTGTVSNVAVNVHLLHNSANQVVLRLTTPWGATVQILDGVSGGSSYNGDYTFSDLGIQTISTLADQSPLPSRVYLPNHPIGTAVSGHPAAGVWTLSVGDDTRNGTQGTLSGWSLDIHTACTLACRADFNGNHTLEVQDIFDYLNAWFAGNPSADFNGGGLAVQDIFDFLNAWFAGCR